MNRICLYQQFESSSLNENQQICIDVIVMQFTTFVTSLPNRFDSHQFMLFYNNLNPFLQLPNELKMSERSLSTSLEIKFS